MEIVADWEPTARLPGRGDYNGVGLHERRRTGSQSFELYGLAGNSNAEAENLEFADESLISLFEWGLHHTPETRKVLMKFIGDKARRPRLISLSSRLV